MRYALLGEVSTDIVVNLARHFYETNNFTDTNFRETIISGYNEIFFSELKGLIIRRCLKLQDSHIKRIKFVASLDQGECYQHAKAYELLNAHLINSDVTSVNLCKRIDKLMHEVIREDINFAVFIIWKVGQAKGWLETTNQDYSKDWEKYIAQSWE